MRHVGTGVLVLAVAAGPATAKEPAVHLNATYEEHALGAEPATPVLRRVDQVTVAEGQGRLGEGKVAHYLEVWVESLLREEDLLPAAALPATGG